MTDCTAICPEAEAMAREYLQRAKRLVAPQVWDAIIRAEHVGNGVAAVQRTIAAVDAAPPFLDAGPTSRRDALVDGGDCDILAIDATRILVKDQAVASLNGIYERARGDGARCANCSAPRSAHGFGGHAFAAALWEWPADMGLEPVIYEEGSR